MKQIRYISLFVGAAVLLASCDKNEPERFDDRNAFAAFDNTTVYVKEDAKENLLIPVTLASVKGLEETVKFEIVELEQGDPKGARAGVNFELVTSSGVLSFDAEHRTQYIEIKPLYYPEYTGDLSFSIKLVDSETLPAGSENVCKVVVNDVDHPLNFMLGEYDATGTSYFNGPSTWTMTVKKDEKDDRLVWIDNIFADASWAGDDMLYYGTVNDDRTVLTIPFGQESEYKYGGTTPIQFLGRDSDLNIYDTGSIEARIIVDDHGTVTLDFGSQYGWCAYIPNAGNINIIMPGVAAVKK